MWRPWSVMRRRDSAKRLLPRTKLRSEGGQSSNCAGTGASGCAKQTIAVRSCAARALSASPQPGGSCPQSCSVWKPTMLRNSTKMAGCCWDRKPSSAVAYDPTV
jgi:hypothetical protein